MIDLKNLHLDGFGSYDKLDFPLDTSGTHFITGPIGSGKSTIPTAIFYLLFGKTIRKKTEFFSYKDLANKVLGMGFDIWLDFEVDRVPYRIREIQDRDGSGLYFYQGERDISEKTETRQKILHTLKMSAEDFKSVALLSRRNTQVLIGGTSAERAKALVDLFGLDRYDTLIGTSDTMAEGVLQERKTLEAQIVQQIEQIETLRGSVDAAVQKSRELETEVEKCQKDLHEVTRALRQVEEKQRGLGDKERFLSDFLARADALAQQYERLMSLERELIGLHARHSQLKRPTFERTKIESALQEQAVQQGVAAQAVARLRQELESLKVKNNICPINRLECSVGVPLRHWDERTAELGQRLQKVQEEHQELEQTTGKLQVVHKQACEFWSLEQQIAEKQKAKSYFQEVAVPESSVERDELQRCRDQIRECERERAHLEALRAKVSTDIQLEQQRREFKLRMQDSIAAAERKAEELKAQNEQLSQRLRYVTVANSLCKKLRVNKVDRILRILETVSNQMLSEISSGERRLEILSKRSTATGKRTLDKISLIMHDAVKAIPVELASDGQEAQISLALLLATWKAAASFSEKSVSCIWLDEVFGPLHNDILNNVFQVVAELSRGLGARNVHVISHRDLDTRLFDSIIRTKQENGISRLEIERLRETAIQESA